LHFEHTDGPAVGGSERRGPVRGDDEAAMERIVRDADSALGGLAIDPLRYEAVVDGVSPAFTATEFRLLHLLAANPGRVFARDSFGREQLDLLEALDLAEDVAAKVLHGNAERLVENAGKRP
jgi:hypothetical protein